MWTIFVVATLYAVLYSAMYVAVPEPFMDEIFHIPQAIKFCHGDFTYDPMITTPPMPYLYSLFLPWIFLPCTIWTLRATVILCGLVSTVLIYDIIRRVHPSMSPTLFNLRVLRSALSPLHFFYHALYYTEPVSTMCVLLMAWCHVCGRTRWAAFFGALSVAARQFNIVWVFMSGMDVLLSIPPTEWIHVRTISRLIGHACVGAGFAAFVWWNNMSFALGHQEYHGGVLHLAMILYCFTFVLAFTGQWKPHLSPMVVLFVPLLSLMGMRIVVHPFLLADNRHIAFTLWRRILHYDYVRQGLLPVVLSLFLPQWNRRTVLFCACTCLAVMLTPLFEPRYFLLPCLIAVIFQPCTTRSSELLGLVQCIAVNGVALACFFGRTFEDVEKWGPGVQRIIW